MILQVNHQLQLSGNKELIQIEVEKPILKHLLRL